MPNAGKNNNNNNMAETSVFNGRHHTPKPDKNNTKPEIAVVNVPGYFVEGGADGL